nr:MAG TPA_asm: hypothetical protein [Caudoviricetes sp.]
MGAKSHRCERYEPDAGRGRAALARANEDRGGTARG